MQLSKLFSEGIPEKKKRVRGPISAAELVRRLENYQKPKPPYPKRAIWISSLGHVDMEKWILDYWCPLPKNETWKSRCYLETGTLVHRILQEHWFNAGILVNDGNTFEEQRVFCPTFGLSGKIDCLFDTFRLLDKRGDPNIHGEIKVCNSYYYGEWQHPSSLPEDYRIQATVYQRLLGLDRTCFILVSRDSFEMRTVFYEGENELWEHSKNVATEFWGHIRDHTLPGVFSLDMGFEDWVALQIAGQPDRVFTVFPCK